MKDINDILMFVVEYYKNYGVLTEEDQIANFVGELQKQISEMDFSVPDGYDSR